MSERERAWHDWQRVEACLWVGLRRWYWFLLAELALWIYLRPVSDWLFIGATIAAAVLQQLQLRRADAWRRQQTEP